MTAEERRKDRGRYKPKLPEEPLLPLFPELQRGTAISFWDDELRMDLAQERALALLEGRDPEDAERAYRAREISWHRLTISPAAGRGRDHGTGSLAG